MRRIAALSLMGVLLHTALSYGQQAPPIATLLPAVVDSPGPPSPPPASLSNIYCGWCPRPEYPPVWGGMEFLIWQFNGAPVHTPILTQATNPADPNSGKLTSPETVVLLGDERYNSGTRYGGRFTLGMWLDSEASVGVEANFLFVSPRSTTQTVSSNGAANSPNLAIPFFNVGTGAEDALVLAGGLNFPGSVTLRIANQIQGSELNFIGNLIRNNRFSFDGLIGFRYLRFKEELDFSLANSDAAVGHYFTAQDSFIGTNNYYAGQIGWRAEYQTGRWFAELTSKVAFGAVNQTVDVSGSSTAVNPGSPASFNFTNVPGGLFALPTNIGHHTQDVFGVMPEADVKIGYRFTKNIQAFVAYNFLYLNNVARPGAVIDHSLNTSQQPASTAAPFTLVGPAAPTFSFNHSDFWAQGISFGMEFKY